MKTTIIQTTTKIFTEARVLLTTRIKEAYLLEPTEGKLLRHKTTGRLFPAGLCVHTEQEIQDYEEITNIWD